jgi:hypothetical protein
MKAHSSYSSVELLESRIAPAALFVNPTTATFTDEDGDFATVKFTKPILTTGNVASIVMTSPSLFGDHLNRINLNGLTAATGTGITITAKVAANGDGLVNVGFVDATGVDLGAVKVGGDLTRIIAGDTANTKTAGLKSLTVQSFGYDALLTGASKNDSIISGPMGSLLVKTDFAIQQLIVNATVPADGKIASITIGGSLTGGSESQSGRIESSGAIGAVKVGGSIIGGGGALSGQIVGIGKIASVTIGGSLRGGFATNAGYIGTDGTIGAIKIARDLIGGSGIGAGLIASGGGLGAVTIGGSVLGGTANNTGVVASDGNIGAVKIGGDLRGGTGLGMVDTGQIFSYSHSIASVTIGGDAVASTGTFNGCILAVENLGPVKIGGSIRSTGDGDFIIRGQGSAAKPLAIAGLTVVGSASNILVLAGYGFNNTPLFGGASIGAVKIGGNFKDGNIVAGVKNLGTDDATGGVGTAADNVSFGDFHDVVISGTAISKIASISIGGSISGGEALSKHYGFVAQQIGSLKIGGVTIPLNPGAKNDIRDLAISDDFTIREAGIILS